MNESNFSQASVQTLISNSLLVAHVDRLLQDKQWVAISEMLCPSEKWSLGLKGQVVSGHHQ